MNDNYDKKNIWSPDKGVMNLCRSTLGGYRKSYNIHGLYVSLRDVLGLLKDYRQLEERIEQLEDSLSDVSESIEKASDCF